MLRANGIAPTPESQPTQTESQSRSPTPGPSSSGSGSGSRGEKRSASRTLSRGSEDVKPDIVDLEELEDVEARVRKAEVRPKPSIVSTRLLILMHYIGSAPSSAIRSAAEKRQ